MVGLGMGMVSDVITIANADGMLMRAAVKDMITLVSNAVLGGDGNIAITAVNGKIAALGSGDAIAMAIGLHLILALVGSDITDCSEPDSWPGILIVRMTVQLRWCVRY